MNPWPKYDNKPVVNDCFEVNQSDITKRILLQLSLLPEIQQLLFLWICSDLFKEPLGAVGEQLKYKDIFGGYDFYGNSTLRKQYSLPYLPLPKYGAKRYANYRDDISRWDSYFHPAFIVLRDAHNAGYIGPGGYFYPRDLVNFVHGASSVKPEQKEFNKEVDCVNYLLLEMARKDPYN